MREVGFEPTKALSHKISLVYANCSDEQPTS